MKKAPILLTITLIVVCTLGLPAIVRVAAENDDKTKFRRVGKPIPNQYAVLFKTDVRGKDVDKFAKRLANDNHGSILHVYNRKLSTSQRSFNSEARSFSVTIRRHWAATLATWNSSEIFLAPAAS